MTLVLVTSGGGERTPDGSSYTLPPSIADDAAPTVSVEPTAGTLADQGPPPPCDTQLSGDFSEANSAELRDQGFIELGRIIQPRSCPLRVANRANQAFVWLADGAEINLASSGLHLITAFGPFYRGSNAPLSDLGFYYQSEQFRLIVSVQDENRVLFVGQETSLRVTLDKQVIELERLSSGGAYLNLSLQGEVSGSRRVLIDSDGTLFFSPAPLSQSLVTNWLTGEVIDVSRMRRAGNVPPGGSGAVRTDCMPESTVCKVYLDEAKPVIPSPLAGVLHCIPVLSASRERLAYELDAGDFRLRISPFGGYGADWQGGCPPRTVSEGDSLPVWPSTYIEAWAADGSRLSVVASR